MRLLPTLNILARVALMFSLTLLAPIGLAWLGQDAGFLPLAEGLTISVVSCLLILLITHPFRRELHVRDGFLLVVGIWLLLPLSAAAPLMLYDPHMGFTYGYFEGMAGLTTTGSTAISNLDALPPSLNLWRHMLSWLGGMGVIVLAVAILPMLGVGGMQMFKAEMPGPIKDAKLKPRIRETARNLWLVYSGLTILCMLLLKLAGMTWFDAVCHAMTTVSLGGISTHNDSVAYFDSPAIEAVMVVFMIAGATNFATHYVALSRRSLMAYWRDSEFKAMLGALLAAVAGLAAYLYAQDIYPDYETSLRHVTFNLISVATNTGYATTDFGAWPLFVPLLMLFLSCFTACAGSTGGGIKMFRALVLLKEAGRQFTTLLHPAAVKPVRIHGRSVPPAMIFAVLGFISLYVISMVVLTFVLLLTGLDFLSSFSAVVASLNNTGPGLGIIGPSANFSIFGPGQVWVCTFAMLLGRLEIFSVLILFTPAFWRN
ncbi:TrkH family potassium uptake protein [Silvimonas amylolytica]|uniref:Trk system potassium uptake protein n=1 Tax=Silvimonas amylolytica TaxID=449663 RepID=A0ABQ2PLF9_9NEIS|nr:potassium transporter TrkG [Silvimonas amylolytica]GGP26094.1 bis(5'-nucleosyl)-tetraphosphatase [Silvimonas amylolytica]